MFHFNPHKKSDNQKSSGIFRGYETGTLARNGLKGQILKLDYYSIDKWGKVFKNGPSKICGRQPLKNLKGYGLLKQTISLQIF